MWCRIIKNVVVETTDIDPVGRYHPDLIWQGCPDNVICGWIYEDGGFSAPAKVVLTIDEARAAKWAEALAGYNAIFARLDLIYPPQERETWRMQEAEAAAYLAWLEAGQTGTPPATPYLSGLVATRGMGETVEDFAKNVLESQKIFAPLGILLNGQQQRHYHMIYTTLSSVDEVLAYEPRYDLPPELATYLGV